MAFQPYIKMLTSPSTKYDLPHPGSRDGYSVEWEYLGGIRRMANGSVAIDLVQATGKRRVSLTWPLLTGSEKATVVAAFDLLKSAACEMRDPDGNVFNVTRDPSNPALKFDAVVAAGGALRWRCTMYLVEV